MKDERKHRWTLVTFLGVQVFSSLFIASRADARVGANGLYNANQRNAAPNSQQHRHHQQWHYEQFALGVCVGQALTEQGVKINPFAPEEFVNLNEDNRETLQTITHTCRDQLAGDSPSQPSPSPSASAAPAPFPSTEPSPNPTPTETQGSDLPTEVSPSATPTSSDLPTQMGEEIPSDT